MTGRSGALLLLLLPAAAGCAKVGPPPGGPEDREAPALAADASTPPGNAAGVAPDSPVTLVFTEGMDRRSVMRALAVFPAVDFRSTAWSDDTLRLEPDPGWAEERNTILRIGTGAKDRRGNALAKPFVLRFTTKAVPDTGRITGRVFAGREKSSTTPLLVFAVPADSARDGSAPGAVAEPDAGGAFTLEGLDTARSWRVAALLDRDGDARPGGRDEVWTVGEPHAFPADSTALTVPPFLVGTLDSLGHIRGEAKADSGRAVGVEARVSGEDTVAARDSLAAAGPFALELPTGVRYRVSAFLDVDGDGRRGAEEPVVEVPEEIRMDLVAEHQGIVVDLTGLGPPVVPDSTAAPPDSTAPPRPVGEEEGP